MADFQASFLNSDGEVDVYSEAGVIFINDHSNYTTNSEDGHALADFSTFRRIQVTMPDATTKVLSSVTEEGAILIDPAATALSLEDQVDHSEYGDWEYEAVLQTVPTYDASVTYAAGDCVYFVDALYKALKTTIGETPVDTPLSWEEIEVDEIPSKYYATIRWAVTYDTEIGWMRLVSEANRDTTGKDLKLLPNNLKFLSSLKLNLLLDAIGNLTEVRDWVGVHLCISQAKEIINDDSFRG